jgi:hypothetical protein
LIFGSMKRNASRLRVSQRPFGGDTVMKSKLILAALTLYASVGDARAERFPDGLQIGSWTTVEHLNVIGELDTAAIRSTSKTMKLADCYGDHCALQFDIQCSAGRYAIYFLGPCPTCGKHLAGRTVVRANLGPGTYELNVKAISKRGFVTAPLTTEQVDQIAKVEWDSIGVSAPGRGYIFTPVTGTVAAFAKLGALCSK